MIDVCTVYGWAIIVGLAKKKPSEGRANELPQMRRDINAYGEFGALSV
jgi:hypothetical protein